MKKHHVVVLGRRWFHKLYGNTYHSVRVCVDGRDVGRVNFAYGYGDQWQQSGLDVLVKAGFLPKPKEGEWQNLRRACESRGWTLVHDVVDVGRKSDLNT